MCYTTDPVYPGLTKGRPLPRALGKKQLYFGFLLNRLDPPPLYLWKCLRNFFLALFQAGKSSSKSLVLGQAPPSLEKCPNPMQLHQKAKSTNSLK